jgi:LemA protein
MKKAWIYVVLAIILIFAFSAWSSYNGFVTADADVKAQLGNLNSAYQQRSDLIPNLVETVKGSAIMEKQTLTDVIDARSKASSIQLTPEALKDPQALQNFQNAQGGLTSALSRLMVVIERYPELKSQQNYTVLMSQLEGQENRIRTERNRYNDVVRDYDVRIRRFPGNLMAGMFGFTVYPSFEAAQGAENAPKVDFGTSGGTGTSTPQTPPAQSGTVPAQEPHGAVRPAPAH